MNTAPKSVTQVERAEPRSLPPHHQAAQARVVRAETEPPYYTIPDLAKRWRWSRASVYAVLRGENVVDFAAPGHRGHKLVPRETVRRIEARHTKVLR